MLITTEMLWNEVQETKRLLKHLVERDEQYSIDEISLYRATKILKLGRETIISEVKKGNLTAQTYRDKTKKIRYRFRLADIRTFQKTREFNPVNYDTVEVERSEDIADRIFNKDKRR